jgi:hypothetical protein
MQINIRLECELKYEPGEGYFVRKDKDPGRAITADEIVSAHTEYALLLLECYPSTWCSMLRLRGESQIDQAEPAITNCHMLRIPIFQSPIVQRPFPSAAWAPP